ncbi:beta-ketoacyl-ACP synthase III [Spirochaetia bacterium 38H-sp]|uniref:Beta-ketoacyl-[acyl-carrier-protein] synthase III n=1 Tax=Rarispira pelagica TaxID=3141764 RepID=A0ABU9U8N3_9SPIR
MIDAMISGTGSYVPNKRMSNDELAQIVDTSDEWIFSHTGIRARHIAAEHEAASDLGVEAAKKALEDAGIEPLKIDLVLVATSTPDYNSYPSTACIIQDRLGCKNAGAMDITAACTGFVYGLETASSFVASGRAKHVLLVGTEVNSRILNWKDRNTCVLFGDAAGAVVVSVSQDKDSRVADSILRSDGSGERALLRPAGGSRKPIETGSKADDTYVTMDGRKVYLFAVDALRRTVEELMQRNSLDIEDVDWIVPHQANVRIIQACANRLGIPQEKFFLNLEEYANTSAASIPLAMDEMRKKGLLKKGNRIITVGFGAGLTYGGNYIIW